MPMGAVFMSDSVTPLQMARAGGKSARLYLFGPSVSAAVGLEVLRLYEGGLLDNGRRLIARLMAAFRAGGPPLVGDVRGRECSLRSNW